MDGKDFFKCLSTINYDPTRFRNQQPTQGSRNQSNIEKQLSCQCERSGAGAGDVC